jgi:non-lysosomal glucosylceramidase
MMRPWMPRGKAGMAAAPGTSQSQDPLLRRGAQRTFQGAALQEIAFPIGGIGTGTVSLGGRGQLRDWEIFNRPGKGKNLPYTFFSLWARPDGGTPIARVLEARLQPPYGGAFGVPAHLAAGLPRLATARFKGAYPFAHIEFEDEALPLQIGLEAFNPFVPGNAEDSGIPVAIFLWTLTNGQAHAVQATVAFSLMNAIGYDGQAPLFSRRGHLYGQNLNQVVSEGSLRGLRMSSAKYSARDVRFGTMAVATTWPDITACAHWERAGWFDDIQHFWDDFSDDGCLAPSDESPTPDNETDIGTLGLTALLAPGETVRLPFILAWHFPNLENYWNLEEAVRGKRLGNEYATRFANAWDAARYTAENMGWLESQTRLFHDALFESTLPDYVLDAVSSQMSTIRTATCLRTEDGRFHAFEGCADSAGCCPLNCTHVWNYAQAPAFLFPQLERSARQTDFASNTRPDGDMAFRTLIPLVGELWAHAPAADGQMGTVIRLYREWQISGDESFLRELWPYARQALEFAWQSWDRDRDGLMEGEQHNTYDIEFYGPNPMTSVLYLGALRAGEEMARALGEEQAATEYRRVYERGRQGMEQLLWNREYYVQRLDDVNGHRYQFGIGCLSDQLLGQWLASVVGLGHLLPEERVRQTLASIYRYNYRADLTEHANPQRVYALNDERGLLLCSWPHGGRPHYPFPYAHEVWTGVEYQVAAHLIYEGFLSEGLTLVQSARERYDGRRRNPWDEMECGHHYARAMSSWSLLLALSGYQYSAPKRSLRFAPRLWPDDFRCFFTAGEAWGSYAQRHDGSRQTHVLDLGWGSLTIERLHVPRLARGARPRLHRLSLAASDLEGRLVVDSATVTVELVRPVTLHAGDSLVLEIAASARGSSGIKA